jgi:hypothetical protein
MPKNKVRCRFCSKKFHPKGITGHERSHSRKDLRIGEVIKARLVDNVERAKNDDWTSAPFWNTVEQLATLLRVTPKHALKFLGDLRYGS